MLLPSQSLYIYIHIHLESTVYRAYLPWNIYNGPEPKPLAKRLDPNVKSLQVIDGSCMWQVVAGISLKCKVLQIECMLIPTCETN